MTDEPFVYWFEKLEQRHLSNLNFSEVRRGVQALSSLYVERRNRRLTGGSALEGAGKRAAFAMFYGALHFLIVREIVRGLKARIPRGCSIVDLGCGTGVAGAAWALESHPKSKIIGVDRSPWVLEESKWTYKTLGLNGTVRPANVAEFHLPAKAAVIAAYTINELDDSARSRFHDEFIKIAERGAPVLVIEPIARRLTPWWNEWDRDWGKAGGREDEWRFRIDLPERLALMDRAAGLDHRELTARSLWLGAL